MNCLLSFNKKLFVYSILYLLFSSPLSAQIIRRGGESMIAQEGLALNRPLSLKEKDDGSGIEEKETTEIISEIMDD